MILNIANIDPAIPPIYFMNLIKYKFTNDKTSINDL